MLRTTWEGAIAPCRGRRRFTLCTRAVGFAVRSWEEVATDRGQVGASEPLFLIPEGGSFPLLSDSASRLTTARNDNAVGRSSRGTHGKRSPATPRSERRSRHFENGKELAVFRTSNKALFKRNTWCGSMRASGGESDRSLSWLEEWRFSCKEFKVAARGDHVVVAEAGVDKEQRLALK